MVSGQTLIVAVFVSAVASSCANLPEPSTKESEGREREAQGAFLVKLNDDELRTEQPLIEVRYYTDKRSSLVTSGFVAGSGDSSVSFGLQLPSEFLETRHFETALTGAVKYDTVGVVIERGDTPFASGNIETSIGQLSSEGTVQFSGSTEGASDEIEFSGPAHIDCMVPRASIPDFSLPEAPVPTDENADEVLVLDEQFASPECIQLKEVLSSIH